MLRNSLLIIRLERFFRIKLALTETDILICHVGYFMPVKNQSFLVDVFAELAKNDSRYHLLLIGDGAMRTEIEQKVACLGLTNKVTFTGNIDNVSEYLNAADIIIMPSLYEGLPLTLVEQQANGLQCAVSDTITAEADKLVISAFSLFKRQYRIGFIL